MGSRLCTASGADLFNRGAPVENEVAVISPEQAEESDYNLSPSKWVGTAASNEGAIKYLDRPFVRGADGTQVLKPRADIDAQFLYYACRSVDVPSRGYNRHFSVFKSLGIAIPSERTEQERIGKVMRVVEAAATRQATLAASVLSMKRAAMRELFIRSIVETLDALPPTIEGNREMLSWLRGERGWYDEEET
jgi:hypothetical protein